MLLRTLPSNDLALADALRRAPTVLVFAGTLEAEPDSAAQRAHHCRAPRPAATPPRPRSSRHAGALTNIDVLEEQASGWGLISVDAEHGVLRRMPLVASIDGTLVPSLALEMLRVATRAPAVRLSSAGAAVTAVAVGDLRVPTEPDAAVRRLLLAAPRRPFRLGGRRAAGQCRCLAAARPTGADRADGDRPARLPGHADRRAHARQRDPRSTDREPRCRHTAAPARPGPPLRRRCCCCCSARRSSGPRRAGGRCRPRC